MHFSAVTVATFAALAAATPVARRGPANNVPSWVCDYWPSYSGCSTSTSTSGTSSSAVTEVQYTPSASTPTSGSSSSSSSSSSSGNEWVTLHNNYRQKHVDTGNVEWDEELAAGAKAWSEKCVFEHSSSSGDYGENLGMGSGLTAEQTVDMWYAEIDGYSSYWGKDDVPMSVMHFTQVVWKGTTKIGCGVASCSDGNLVTCRYNPAGNMLGDFAANVGELKSSS